jgi:hypothetical protein
MLVIKQLILSKPFICSNDNPSNLHLNDGKARNKTQDTMFMVKPEKNSLLYAYFRC